MSEHSPRVVVLELYAAVVVICEVFVNGCDGFLYEIAIRIIGEICSVFGFAFEIFRDTQDVSRAVIFQLDPPVIGIRRGSRFQRARFLRRPEGWRKPRGLRCCRMPDHRTQPKQGTEYLPAMMQDLFLT